MAQSPAAIIYDSTGVNPVGVVLDGAVYRLQVEADLKVGHGLATEATVATLATEVKLEAVRALLATIDVDTGVLAAVDYATQTTLAALLAELQTKADLAETQPVSVASLPLPTGAATEATLSTLSTEVKLEAVRALLASLDGKDFATQATLAAQAGDIAALLVNSSDIETILTAIRDTAGIKKITDALPAGTNDIGDVGALGIDESATQHQLMTVEDAQISGLHRLAITGQVTVQIPPPPQGGIKLTVSADTPLAISNSNSPHLTEYEITNGKTLHIQQIVAGCQGDPSADGSKCEYFYWDGTTERLLDRIYIVGQTQFGNYPDTSETRDGTAMIGMPTAGEGTLRIYRSRLSNSSQEIDTVIRGYEV